MRRIMFHRSSLAIRPILAGARSGYCPGTNARPPLADEGAMIEISRIAWGGNTLYGARVGILMLETRFPRIPGDMGNAETWPFPVLYKVVPGASPRRVVCEKAQGLLAEFLTAAHE